MTPQEYIELTGVTDRKSYTEVQDRLSQEEVAKLFHFFVGIATESGELLDALKKSVIYGKTLDKVNLKEELGDVMWYVARACSVLNLTLEEVMEVNINKLKARYGAAFTEHAAVNRDLNKERTILEDSNA